MLCYYLVIIKINVFILSFYFCLSYANRRIKIQYILLPVEEVYDKNCNHETSFSLNVLLTFSYIYKNSVMNIEK